jgi:hypothetical protein
VTADDNLVDRFAIGTVPATDVRVSSASAATSSISPGSLAAIGRRSECSYGIE